MMYLIPSELSRSFFVNSLEMIGGQPSVPFSPSVCLVPDVGNGDCFAKVLSLFDVSRAVKEASLADLARTWGCEFT